MSDTTGGSDERFWMKLYEAEERDARRTTIRAKELSHMKFDLGQWFSLRDFRNAPHEYSYREIPDDEAIKATLDW